MAQVFPTKTNLINTKKSLELASLGYDLLDRKRSILVREMMELIDKAGSIRSEINETYARAYLALQRANVTLGMCAEFARTIPLEESLDIDLRSVMGVEIPVVTLAESSYEMHYGMNATNSALDEAYLEFERAKHLTARLAEIESGVCRLADAVKKTQKRANALNNVMIPQFTETVRYITDALEESERESFSRLKVIKEQKEKEE